MFGYVTCDKAELKMKDWERYNAYYCGVCKSIGKRYGQIPRMILTFDAAFIAILLSGLTEEPAAAAEALDGSGYSLTSERCIAHPVKEKLVVREAAVDYAADVMLLLAYYKMEDDRQDEHTVKAAAAARYLCGAKGRIEKERAALGAVLAEQLRRQSELESQLCSSVDQAADPTGRIMEAVFTEGLKALPGEAAGGNAMAQRILSQFGYQLGRWIYLIDAADDLKEDIVSGGYNPFKERFLYDPAAETKDDFSKRVHDDAERILLSCLADMAAGLDLLEIRRHHDIIKNVVQFGLLRQTDKVLEKLKGTD